MLRFCVKCNKIFKENSPFKVITNQLIRSVTSISANIAEGSASVSKKEFVNYTGIARKSAVETVYWLKFLSELNKDNNFKDFIDEGQQIVKMLSKIVINTKNC